jgi:PIN domain nuclease of toxin-antitoxin system
MVLLELQLLHERGRIPQTAKSIFKGVADGMDLELSEAGFADVVEAAAGLDWTRDPFDRLIVATAAAEGSRLVTADEEILANFKLAVW